LTRTRPAVRCCSMRSCDSPAATSRSSTVGILGALVGHRVIMHRRTDSTRATNSAGLAELRGCGVPGTNDPFSRHEARRDHAAGRQVRSAVAGIVCSIRRPAYAPRDRPLTLRHTLVAQGSRAQIGKMAAGLERPSGCAARRRTRRSPSAGGLGRSGGRRGRPGYVR
jgi:hypothetical protein